MVHIEQAFQKLTEFQKLNFSYHQNYFKLIGIDLSRQVNTSVSQQINIVGKLEKYNGARMLFIAEKQHQKILNFSLDSLLVTE